MKKLTKTFTGKSEEVLKKEANDLDLEIAKQVLQSKSSPQKDTNVIWKLRKKKAVLLTVLGQKESSKK